MQKERWQQREGDRITPIEHPVQTIEWTAERETEDAEEGDAQPEKVQSGLIVRTAKTHGRPDQQREQSHSRQHEIHRAAPRRWRQRHLQRLTRSEAEQRIRQARSRMAAMLEFDDSGPKQRSAPREPPSVSPVH